MSKPIPDPGFAGDMGEADASLRRALDDYERGAGDDDGVLAALASARLIVPVTAVPAETAVGPDGLEHDKQVDMALPVMVGTDGRRALPAFTSLETMAAWDPAARPVPVETRRAALGAIAEHCDFLVVDPAGPVSWVADRAQVESLAAGDEQS
jgi:hypothetical protein